MKLKTWLLSSYLIVMILPLLMAYLLFAWINDYNEDQKVKEFFSTTTELQKIQTVLKDPKLYIPKANHPEIEQLITEQIAIILYNQHGLVLYASNPVYSTQPAISQELLYEDLYTLKQGFRTHQYKQPVFDGNNLIGFFQIELSRDEWVNGVSEKTKLTIGIFIALFALLYVIVVMFVNRKVNRRLTGLKNEMTAFASGYQVKEMPTNEDEIGELQKHFYDMQRKMTEAKEIIEQEQQAKTYLIASISHDLKTPLTSIRAYAESLELNTNLSVEEQSEYRQVIVEKSNFMKLMLDDLLTYTLLQSPTYEIELVDVDGTEFFDMLVSGYEPLCEAKGIQLHVSSQVAGFYEVNPKQMMRVVDNLMSNAMQHTNSNGHIWLAADSEVTADWLFDFVKEAYLFDFKENMYVIVQNEGKGIAVEKMEQIFNPLFQADDARSKKEATGTGLGLSITKQVLEKHGGNIQLLSKEEEGTCVICRLPILRKH